MPEYLLQAYFQIKETVFLHSLPLQRLLSSRNVQVLRGKDCPCALAVANAARKALDTQLREEERL